MYFSEENLREYIQHANMFIDATELTENAVEHALLTIHCIEVSVGILSLKKNWL